jgi:hypothetical protein
VLEDLLLILGTHILVIQRLLRLGIYPAGVGFPVLQAAVEVLDKTGDEGQFEKTLDLVLSNRLHLPARTRTAKRSNLCVAGDDDDLLEINDTTKLGELGLGVKLFDLWERKLEVCSWQDLNLAVKALSSAERKIRQTPRGQSYEEQQHPLDTVGDLEIGSIFGCDRLARVCSLPQVHSDLGGDSLQVGNGAHAAVEISPNRFDLADIEQERMPAENVQVSLKLAENAEVIQLAYINPKMLKAISLAEKVRQP